MEKKQRICSKCKKSGHNTRTCPGIVPVGHQILIDEKKKAPRGEINGIKPKKGIWIINRDKKKIAGQIDFVKKSGIIVWRSISVNALVESTQETLKGAGYEYSEEMPQGDGWINVNAF